MYNKSDVVYGMTVILTAKNIVTEQTNSIEFFLGIPFNETNFLEFSELSEDELLRWVGIFLSESEIQKYKSLASGLIEHTSIKTI